jgi:hypothetical protein
VWQRPYPRGRESALSFAQDLLDRYIVTAGMTIPAGGGASAGWVMLVDRITGDIGWQRYYRGAHAYQVRDLMVAKDGMMTVMLNGQPLSGAERAAYDTRSEEEKQKEAAGLVTDKQTDFVRLLTLTPRGILFVSDEYFNSEGAQAEQMIIGPVGERIMIGATEVAYSAPATEGKDTKTTRSQKAWVVAGTSMELSNDPCMMNGQ